MEKWITVVRLDEAGNEHYLTELPPESVVPCVGATINLMGIVYVVVGMHIDYVQYPNKVKVAVSERNHAETIGGISVVKLG